MNEEEKIRGEGQAPTEQQVKTEEKQQGQESAQSGMSAQSARETFDRLERMSGWSWGGFMFGPAYLIATKNYTYLLLYLLWFVPLVNIIASLGIAIFLGLKGHQMVAESVMFKNDDERNGFNRAIDHAGFISFLIFAAFMVLGILFLSMLGGFFGGMMHEFGSPVRY